MTRKIAWENIWIETLEQEITWPEECGEPRAIEADNWILCRWTAEEVTRLFSALAVGADLIYPDARHEVLLSFLKQWDCPMDLCEQIAVCIEAASGTGNDLDIALQQYLEEAGLGGSLSSADDDVLGLGECDYDAIFAMSRQMVQLFHRLISDVYENIEAATNNLEAVAAATDLVPGWSQALDLVDTLISNVSESYASEYSVELENDYACDLFCLAIANDCVLSWNDICDYFADRVDGSRAPGDFETLIEWVITGSYLGEQICHVSFSIMTAMLKYGGSYVGLTLRELTNMMAALANDDDGDWTVLCDECAPWKATFDLSADMSMFSFDVGSYVSGNGAQTADFNSEGIDMEAVRIRYPFDTLLNLTKCSVRVSQLSLGTWSGDNSLWSILGRGGAGDAFIASRTEMVAGGPATYWNTGEWEVEVGNQIVFWLRVSRNHLDGWAIVDEIVLWGQGDPGAQFKADATVFEWLT